MVELPARHSTSLQQIKITIFISIPRQRDFYLISLNFIARKDSADGDFAGLKNNFRVEWIVRHDHRDRSINTYAKFGENLNSSDKQSADIDRCQSH